MRRKKVVRFEKQDYKKLRKDALDTGVPFTDGVFLAHMASLFYDGKQPSDIQGSIEWKRPSEMSRNPRLIQKGERSCDVVQGFLGNCWFVAACSVLAQHTNLLDMVIPNKLEQEFDRNNPDSHPGIFHFRFWRMGCWIDVCVDDKLPTLNGQLIYARPREKNEYWGPLLEKAYAKLSGCYEALNGGNLSDALVDFTGGVTEVIKLQEKGYTEDEESRKALFNTLLAEVANKALMCAAIAVSDSSELEKRTEMGLVKGHAYGVTAMKKVPIGSTGLMTLFTGRKKIDMVRLRNPWGGCEWNGPFSDSSKEWAKISLSEREKLGLTFEEDGEFWMTFEDFVHHFTDVSVCQIQLPKLKKEAVFLGRWTVGSKGSKDDRAGGCLNNRASFLLNPQYRFDVSAKDDQILICLMQEDQRAFRKENHVIGFHVMRVELNRVYRLHTIKEAAATSDYVRSRSVSLQTRLTKGRYVIVPTTFDPECEGRFMLRIFTSYNSCAKELVHDVPKHSLFPCFRYPCLTSLVKIRGASGLEKQDRFGSANPYCIVICEGKRIRTQTCQATLNPMWNESAIFLRKKAESPIKFEVWNSNIICDSLIGKGSVTAPMTPEPVLHQVELVRKKGQEQPDMPGRIVVEITTSENLKTF